MSDRNWDAELAKIDKQLASISDEQLVAEKRAATTAKPGAAVPAASATVRPAALPAGAPVVVKPAGTWRGWVQTAVAVAAAIGLVFWPWPPNCGLPLYGLIAASGVTSLLGVWSAIGSWRHRIGAAHILSIAVVAWGLLFGAREVLPRVGYAMPDGIRGGSWECVVAPLPAVPAQAPVPPPTVPPG